MFQTNLLWQNDDRWANSTLGYGPQTIKQWGCLNTSLTMVVNAYGYNETPATLNQKMTKIGAFFGSAINAYRIGEAFPGVALKNLVDCESPVGSAPMSDIDAELAANRPVVVRVDWSPSAGLQDHWVVLYGKENNDYLMLDPWCYQGDAQGKKNYLTQRYKNTGTTPAAAITSVIFFNITKPGSTSASTSTAATPTASTLQPASSPATKVPVPAGAVKVTPTQDQLAFRGSPNVTGALLRRFPMGTTLTSLESPATTLSKIGVDGQWLQVQAPEGDQGYVAAWYVANASASTRSAGAAPSTASSNAVKVTQDQLAFRSQPVVADNNLISRFPLGTLLTVTDPDGNQKIGVVNQWLKVRDASGRDGYVAAWYVSR
jgi:hypothetical protein